MEESFGYDLGEPLDQVRTWYAFDPSCRGTVPYALRAFLEAGDYEECVRLAVSLGGDSDTLACIAGSVAGAYYGVPAAIREKALEFLDEPLRKLISEFEDRYSA